MRLDLAFNSGLGAGQSVKDDLGVPVGIVFYIFFVFFQLLFRAFPLVYVIVLHHGKQQRRKNNENDEEGAKALQGRLKKLGC